MDVFEGVFEKILNRLVEYTFASPSSSTTLISPIYESIYDGRYGSLWTVRVMHVEDVVWLLHYDFCALRGVMRRNCRKRK